MNQLEFLTHKTRIEVALLDMRRALANIESFNQSAAREEALGGWRQDWLMSVAEENQNYEAAKKRVEVLLAQQKA